MRYRTTSEIRQWNTRYGSVTIQALNWGNMGATRRLHYVYRNGMRLWERDVEILDGVSSFGAMSTAQIAELYFHGIKHPSSWYDVLKRLVDNGALTKIPFHLPQHSRGGSPMGYYQIGRKSWPSFHPGTTYKEMQDQYKFMHTLFVVDLFVELKRLERAELLAIRECDEESDAWVKDVGGVELHPDMHLDLDLKQRREYQKLWVEADLSNEYRQQITAKVQRYIDAYRSGQYQGDVFPRVVFVARKDERVRTLKRYLKQIPGAEQLVVVYRVDEFLRTLQ